MNAEERLEWTLTELESFISTAPNVTCVLRQKVATLRTDWEILSAFYKNILQEFEELKMSKISSQNNTSLIKTEGLKLITPKNSSYQSNGNLFNRRTRNQQQQEAPFGMSMSPVPKTLSSQVTLLTVPSLVRSPARSPELTSPNGDTGQGHVRDIVRRLSTVSSSSSNSSTVSSSSSSSPDSMITATTIRQRGREKKFEFFQEIFHSPILEFVTSFTLNFIQIETSLLFDSLERCPNLTHLELTRVIFLGPFNRPVLLPKLKNYLVSQQSSETKHLCEAKNISKVEFANFLFFALWERPDPIPLSICRIEYMTDGWTQFKLNYDSGEFVSRLSFTNDILRVISPRFKIRRMALQAFKFKVDLDQPENLYEDLTYLNFSSILTSSKELSKVLSQCHNLQELRFKNFVDGGNLYLKDIPSRRLKFLSLGLCTYTLTFKYSPNVRFNLDTLIFPTNSIDDPVLQNLPQVFNAKKVIVYLCSHGSRCKSLYYILDKLLQIESIEWIWLSNIRRSLIGEDLESELQLQLQEKYEDFLAQAGLPLTSGTSIILEKKELQNFQHGGHSRIKWVGREMTKEEQQVVEFQNRDGYKFSTWEAYMKRY